MAAAGLLTGHIVGQMPARRFAIFLSSCSRRIGVTLPVQLHFGQTFLRPGQAG
jgi:hypothetical protein